MTLILGIETATEICSASLTLDGKLVALKESNGSNEHSSLLTTFIEWIINDSGYKKDQLDAVAVSVGPGSYTGLRIGVSVAKGLCYALDIPLISVGSLQAMAFRALNKFSGLFNSATLLCPMIDARRMEVFMALYDQSLNEISKVEAVILNEGTFRDFSDFQVAVFGNGAAKCRELFSGQPNIVFPGPLDASADVIGQMASKKFMTRDLENTAYFEPFYLKDFIAGKPKVKGLRE